MKISIITASYNYAQYIEEAINSVINQFYQDWELIIVDDGSSDNSVGIIKSYCEKDSRIKLFQHENGQNKGLKETLLLGISHATGDWVAFLESDDIFKPENLQKKVEIIEEAKCKVQSAKGKWGKVNGKRETEKCHCEKGVNDLNSAKECSCHCEKPYLQGDEAIQRKRKGNNKAIVLIFNKMGYLCETEESQKQIKFHDKKQRKLARMRFPQNMFYQFYVRNMILSFSCVMVNAQTLRNADFNTPNDIMIDWWLWINLSYENDFYYLDEDLTTWRLHDKSYIQKNDYNTRYNLPRKAYFKRFKQTFNPLILVNALISEVLIILYTIWRNVKKIIAKFKFL